MLAKWYHHFREVTKMFCCVFLVEIKNGAPPCPKQLKTKTINIYLQNLAYEELLKIIPPIAGLPIYDGCRALPVPHRRFLSTS